MNSPVYLEPPEHRWACPSCSATHVTRESRPHVPVHPCPGLKGFIAPYVEVTGHELKKHSVRHRLIEREDYIGKEHVTTDPDGRPIMALSTDREDGSNDLRVFAPTARAHIG